MEPYNHIREADKAEINQLLKTFGISNSVIADLRLARPILEKNIDRVLDDFYGGILADPVMSQVFKNNHNSQLQAKAMQRIHWLDWVFAANFNAHYLARCKRIGQVHQDRGILPTYYLFGYRFVSQAVKDLIFETCSDAKLAQRLTQSVEKAIFLDISLAISVYCTEMSASWRRTSLCDQLTNILNRRGATEKLNDIVRAHKGSESTTSLGLLDIDHFKNVNDNFGHDIGDLVLKFVAKLIEDSLRDSDIVGRWGGEEFIIIMPDTCSDMALLTCSRLLETLEKSVTNFNDQSISVTASIGVSSIHREETSFDPALHRADIALYQAKDNGRNRALVSKENTVDNAVNE